MLKVFSCIDSRKGAMIFGLFLIVIASCANLRLSTQLLDKDYKSTTERNIVIAKLNYSSLILIFSVFMSIGVEKRLYILILPWLAIWGFGTAVIYLYYSWYIIKAMILYKTDDDDFIFKELMKMLIFAGIHNCIWNFIYLIYIEMKVSSKQSAPTGAAHTT